MSDNAKITFPKDGILVYPALSRPDTKFDALGQYKADVKLPRAAAKPFMDKIQARAKAHMGKPLKNSENSVWKAEVDDNGDETGNVIFSIRVKNRTGKDGKTWDRKPLVIDAKKTPIDCNPWGGTVARVQAEIYEWEFGGKKGISLQPLVVQVLNLVTGKGSEPDLGDFDEEDGFEGSAEDLSAFDNEGDDTSSDDDESADY